MENGMVQTQRILTPEEEQSLRTYTMVVYGLYAAALVVLLTGLIGVIIAYIKKGDAAGTMYEGHLAYLIKTFWWTLLGGTLGLLTAWFGVGLIIWIITAVWFVYRMAAGFIKFFDGKPIGNEKP